MLFHLMLLADVGRLTVKRANISLLICLPASFVGISSSDGLSVWIELDEIACFDKYESRFHWSSLVELGTRLCCEWLVSADWEMTQRTKRAVHTIGFSMKTTMTTIYKRGVRRRAVPTLPNTEEGLHALEYLGEKCLRIAGAIRKSRFSRNLLKFPMFDRVTTRTKSTFWTTAKMRQVSRPLVNHIEKMNITDSDSWMNQM
jgi:hypothetical protein